MPDGSERAIQGIKSPGNIYPKKVIHGRYMDNLTSLSGGSVSSCYYDSNYHSNEKSRVVFRSHADADADGGVSYAFSNFDSAHVSARIGSRLAFRGAIKKITSVSDFVNLEMKP